MKKYKEFVYDGCYIFRNNNYWYIEVYDPYKPEKLVELLNEEYDQIQALKQETESLAKILKEYSSYVTGTLQKYYNKYDGDLEGIQDTIKEIADDLGIDLNV